jgi:hypothetical protein
MRRHLDLLEEKANAIKVPVTYANLLYTLRDHIVLVRELLETKRRGCLMKAL